MVRKRGLESARQSADDERGSEKFQPSIGLRVVCFLGAPRHPKACSASRLSSASAPTEDSVSFPTSSAPSSAPSYPLWGTLFPQSVAKSSMAVAVDGGLQAALDCMRNGQAFPPELPKEWLWVGDGDSLGHAPHEALNVWKEVRARGVALSTLQLPPEKDVSDFGAALDALEAKLKEEHKFEGENKSEGEKAGATDGLAQAAPHAAAQVAVYVVVQHGLGGRNDHELCNFLEAADFLERLQACGLSGVVDFEGKVVCFSGDLNFACTPGALFTVCALKGNKRVHIEGARYSGDICLHRASHGLSNVVEAPLVVLRGGDGGGVFLLFLD